MKRLISIILCFCLCFGVICINVSAETATDGFDCSPSDFVQRIGAGWNLGNTLENNGTYSSVYAQETAFVKVETSKEMIDFVANTGFNAVRIPVSWGPQTVKNSNGDYVVKTDLLKRLKTIAGWCFENNMFVIINMHHDDRKWLNISATGDEWEEVKKQYQQTWQQIGEYFKDYDERLILEGGNEILATQDFDGCKDGATGWCWWGHSNLGFNKQNELYQIFVDTVRATGGNNDKRFLMLPTYGAQWYENQVGKLLIPNNDKHIIMDIHWYSYGDQMKPNTVASYASMWEEYAKARGIGVVIGECGFNESVASATKVSWANSFVSTIRGVYKIPVFLWDDGGDMRMMTRKQGQPIAWTSNSDAYAKAVVTNSRPYIVGGISYLLGDANNNGSFDTVDILYFRKQLVKSLSKEFYGAADVNRDGNYDIRDLLKMRRVLAKLDSFYS